MFENFLANPMKYAIMYLSLKEFNFLVSSHLLIPSLKKYHILSEVTAYEK